MSHVENLKQLQRAIGGLIETRLAYGKLVTAGVTSHAAAEQIDFLLNSLVRELEQVAYAYNVRRTVDTILDPDGPENRA